MGKKIQLFIICGALLLLPVLAIWRAEAWPRASLSSLADGSYFSAVEEAVAGGLPARGELRRLNLQLGLLGGQREQNDIFISADGLIKNIPAADVVRIQQNVDSILHVAQEVDCPTYLLLIPTSGAILQEKLPPYTELANNQKQVIDSVYQQMAGKVTVIDVYSSLFRHREEYIYYRTENNLTALGGYYVYAELGAKLVGQAVYAFSQFEIEYVDNSYYGNLYQQSPYPDVRPDVLALYRYNRGAREYMVSHVSAGAQKVYHVLYPTHLVELGHQMDVYLGGLSAVTQIRTSTPYARSLLVFGDETALAYLPFLANNYQQITLVDLSQMNYEQASELDIYRYDQVLYAYSVETFNTNIPIWAEMLL